MSVVESVEADLAMFDARLPGVSSSAVAASALVLAGKLDDPHNSATSVSLCAKALREAMEAIEARLPPAKTTDGIDDLTKQRERRRAVGGAAS